MKPCFKTFSLFLIFTTLVLTSAFAGGKKDKLFDVIENGSYKEVKSLLRNHKDYVNVTRGAEKENLLMVALKEDRDLDVINILLKYGADPDKKSKTKRNALSYAVQYSSHPEVIERLIKVNNFFDFSKRKRINKKDKNGKNCFDWAKENSNPEMVEKVLRKYVKETPVKDEPQEEESEDTENEDTENIPESITASNPAASNIPPVYTELEKDFIETPAPINKDKIEDQIELDETDLNDKEIEEKNEVEVQPEAENKTLPVVPPVKEGDEPAVESEPEETPVYTPEPATLEKPVYTPAPVPEVKPYTRSYLMDYAEIETDDDPVIEDPNYDPDHIFIENADSKDINGRTRLMKAAKAGDLKLIDNLLYAKAGVNLKDNDGWTALMFAARFSENPDITKILIENNADVFVKNNYGVTALKLSAGFNKNSEVTRLILSKYRSADNEVRNCFIYAITSGAPVSVIEAFWKKGVNLNSIYDGKTPLMYAAETNKDTVIIDWLIKHGAKTTYKSTDGKTAFDYARLNKSLPKDKIYWSLNSTGAN